METLEKIIGKNELKKIEIECKGILRDCYRKSYNLTSATWVYIDEREKSTRTAINILRRYGHLKYIGRYGPPGRAYKITKKGKEFYDKNFRVKGEYFNIIEKWDKTFNKH